MKAEGREEVDGLGGELKLIRVVACVLERRVRKGSDVKQDFKTR